MGSFEEEDRLIATAVDCLGERIEQEVIKKIFSLPASQILQSEILNTERKDLDLFEKESVELVSEQIMERNGEFFDLEVDKLDKWAEDMKKSLEIELKKLDIDIKTMKTNAKKITILEEKVKSQKQIKELEKKRNDMRQRLYEAQDEVDKRKENLIERVEKQLKQKSNLTEIFYHKVEGCVAHV